ncbi:hypothetical protein LSH36_317g03076, partial [Paralvinella palmiformis]
ATKMRPKPKVMDVHQVFQEFADGTSMHGVPRIINARSITARVFWSVICLGAFGMFFWQCGILLQRYYSYPKKVNVEILQKPVPFPAVSVCNVGHMDYEIAAALADELRDSLGLNYGDNYTMGENDNGTDYYYDFDGSDPAMYESLMEMAGLPPPGTAGAGGGAGNETDFIPSYMDFMYNALSFLPAYSVFYSNTDFSIEALSRLALPANLGTKVTSSGGVKLRDFIINCRFMDDKCNITKSFEQIFDPYYFNCFTFNPEHILPSRSMRLRGVDYGLSLLLFTGSAGQVPKASLGMNLGDSNRSQEAFFLPGVEESDSALASGRGARGRGPLARHQTVPDGRGIRRAARLLGHDRSQGARERTDREAARQLYHRRYGRLHHRQDVQVHADLVPERVHPAADHESVPVRR